MDPVFDPTKGGGVAEIYATVSPQVSQINSYLQAFLNPNSGGVDGSGFDASNPSNVLMLQLITERLSTQTQAASSSMASLFSTARTVLQNIQ